MYEYAPRSSKKTEKGILISMLICAVLSFGVVELYQWRISFLFQLIGFASLGFSILITSRCLLRRFTYRVEPREGGAEWDAPDLVITEYHGHHVGVVCRISVNDIEEILLTTPKNRREISSMLRKKRVYHYTAQLVASNIYLLTVRDEEEIFYLRMLADETLLSYLKNAKKQYLSDSHPNLS